MWYSQMIFRKNNFVFFPSNHHVPKSNFDCFPPIKLPQIFSYFAALFSCCWCLITCYCYFCYKVIVYENKVTCIFLKSINSKNYLKNIFTITVPFLCKYVPAYADAGCLHYTSTTGCFNAKRDVLNCWCDLAFEFLVFWLSLVWSWVAEIYARSIIWNCFDLRQPQIKSVKIQRCFCSISVKLF